MLKRIVLALFVIGVLFSGGQQGLENKAYASTCVYTDDNYVVSVENVYRKSDVNIDTDVHFIIMSSLSGSDTHYEFLKRDGTWLYRTHKYENGPWAPVNSNAIAQAIFNYAYYNS